MKQVSAKANIPRKRTNQNNPKRRRNHTPQKKHNSFKTYKSRGITKTAKERVAPNTPGTREEKRANIEAKCPIYDLHGYDVPKSKKIGLEHFCMTNDCYGQQSHHHGNHISMSTNHYQVAGKWKSLQTCEFTGGNGVGLEKFCFLWLNGSRAHRKGTFVSPGAGLDVERFLTNYRAG